MGSRSPAPATVAIYSPGSMRVLDVERLGLAVALAYEAIGRGADMAVVRDTHGVMQLALDSTGRVWQRGTDGSAATVAGWGHAS